MTAAFKTRALRLFSGGMWLGLATKITTEPGGTRLVEEPDPAYTRAPVMFTDPERVGALGMSCENAEVVRFPAYRVDASAPVRYWFVATAPTAGEILAAGELEQRDGAWPQLLEGDEFVFRRGQLVLEMP